MIFPENFCGEFKIVFEGIRAQAVDEPLGVGWQNKVVTGRGRGGSGFVGVERPELVEHEFYDIESGGASSVIGRMAVVVIVVGIDVV